MVRQREKWNNPVRVRREEIWSVLFVFTNIYRMRYVYEPIDIGYMLKKHQHIILLAINNQIYSLVESKSRCKQTKKQYIVKTIQNRSNHSLNRLTWNLLIIEKQIQNYFLRGQSYKKIESNKKDPKYTNLAGNKFHW